MNKIAKTLIITGIFLIGHIIFFSIAAMGQENDFTIRAGAAPEASPGIIHAGEVFIDIYMNNNLGYDCMGYKAPFSIYSPDESITEITYRDIGGEGLHGSILFQNGFEDDIFWNQYNYGSTFYCNGTLPDSFNLRAAALNEGFPSGLGEQVYIRVAIQVVEEGTLCIDSVEHPGDLYDWFFSDADYHQITVDFNGPYCWDVEIDATLGRCCYGAPESPMCANTSEVDCIVLPNYISWDGGVDCTVSCPIPMGRCCYGDPEAPNCTDETQVECNDRSDHLSWKENLDCTSPCPAYPFTVRAGAAPEVSPGIIQTGDAFIDIYMNNNLGYNLRGYHASFVIYSPDESITNIEHRDIGGAGPNGSILLQNGFEDNIFWSQSYISTWSWDGALPDTFNHTAYGSDVGFPGFPSGLGEQVYIRAAIQVVEEGTLCIDSVDHPEPIYDWLFMDADFNYLIVDFDGPYCWNVGIDPTLGRCCYGTPQSPGCANISLADCLVRPDYISWDGGVDCTVSCPILMGRCCYGDPETPSCTDETQIECEDRFDYFSWNENLDCMSPCPAYTVTIWAGADPEVSPGIIQAGNAFIDIYMNNNLGYDLKGYRASFVIYSPDESITNIEHRDIGGVIYNESILLQNGFEDDIFWDEINGVSTWSWDGALPDTFGFWAATDWADDEGFPSGLGEQVYIRAAIQVVEEGTLCIDSIDHPIDTFDWFFWDFDLNYLTVDFNGPYCWDVEIDPTPGRCCYGAPESPSCANLSSVDCMALPDYISWDGGVDCTESCPVPMGRCCYGDPETPSCTYETQIECENRSDYHSWNESIDCQTPCPTIGRCCYGDPGAQSCIEEFQINCENRHDFLSWYEAPDCSTPCPDPLFDQFDLFTVDFWCVNAVDLDNDNNTDLIYTRYKKGLYVAFGNGDASFDLPVELLADCNIFTFAFVNDDDLIDIIAISEYYGQSIAVLLNLGNRDFDVSFFTHSSSFFIYGITTGYFNNDAFVDIVIPSNKVYFGDGLGNFPNSTTLPVDFYTASVSDFNNDGIDDIVVVSANDKAIIYCSNGLGGFTYTGGFDLPSEAIDITTANSLADFNRDGNSDFAAVAYDYVSYESYIYIGFGDGDGDILYVDSLAFDGGAHYIVSSDVDRDTNLDLITCNISNAALDIYFGDESGNFTDHTRVDLDVDFGYLPFVLATGDFDRDGNPDFVTGAYLSSEPVKLLINNLPDAPVINDHKMMMVTTGYDYVNIEVKNPDLFNISRNYSTIAGSDYWRSDFDGSGEIDETTIDYNLQYGEYKIIMTPKPTLARGARASMGIRINGTEQVHTFYNYDLSLDPSEEFIFYYTVEETPSMQPPNGKATGPLPTFNWSGLLDGEPGSETFHFQLDPFYDFRAPLYDITDLTSPTFTPSIPLGIDSVFYWRFRTFDGIDWSEYSRTMAAYIVEYVCGDVDGQSDINILDIVYLINYKYKGGPAPDPLESADVNSDELINILDIVYLINYKYKSGAEPVCP